MYFNSEFLKGEYENVTDSILLNRLLRLKIINLKQIISRTIGIIHRVKNGMKETSIYSKGEKDIVNTFIKTIKRFKVKNEKKSKPIFKHWKYISNKNKIDDIPENIKIDYNNNHINVTLLDSLNNLDSKLLFFLIYNFNRLLEYNDKLTNKSTLSLLIVRLIEFNFDQYYLPYENIEVRKLETLININAPNMDNSARVVSSFEEIYNSQELDDIPSNMTEDEIKDMKYDMQEENDALDLDGYGNGDDDEDDAYMPESEMD